MAYQRIIELYDSDAETLLQTLSSSALDTSKITDASFELLRLGGCGNGSLTVNDKLTARSIEVGQHIKMKYDASTVWYFGRVEEVEYESSSGATVRLYGLFSYLNEITIGGLYFGGLDRRPHLYAVSDYFIQDPDHSVQSWDTCSRYDQMLGLIYDQYIEPNSPIGLGTVAEPTSYTAHNGFQSAIFRSQETAALVVRSVAAAMDNSSYGVDETGAFFVKPREDTVLQTFKEGVDLTSLKYKKDKSLLYTRMYLTGDYIYDDSLQSGFYRYQAVVWDSAGRDAYGDRQIQIYIPYIRTNADAFDFARGFFQQYAQPTVRIDCTTLPQGTLLRPWNGRLTIKDRDDGILLTDYFSRLRCTFNANPFFDLTIGAEELQYNSPPEPERWELGNPNADQIDGGGSSEDSVTATFETSGNSSSDSSSSDAGGGGPESSSVFAPASGCDFPDTLTADVTVYNNTAFCIGQGGPSTLGPATVTLTRGIGGDAQGEASNPTGGTISVTLNCNKPGGVPTFNASVTDTAACGGFPGSSHVIHYYKRTTTYAGGYTYLGSNFSGSLVQNHPDLTIG